MTSNLFGTDMPAGRGRYPSKHLRLANQEQAQYNDCSKENYDNGELPCVWIEGSWYYFYVVSMCNRGVERFFSGSVFDSIGSVELFRC